MNIILLSSSRQASGGARQALYQARGLLAAGHQVHFVAPPDSEMHALAPELHWVDLPPNLSAASHALRALMPEGQPTVLHAFHNRGAKLAGYLGTFWRMRRLPVVCALHRGVTSKPGNPLPYLLPGIRIFVANSQACADTLPLFWRKHRCHVLANAIPPDRLLCEQSPAEVRKSLNIPEDHFIIGDVGHHKPEKGVSRLLEAYAKARPSLPPSTLVIVGSGPERCGSLPQELGIAEHVRLIPRTQHVADYVQCFNLFVFPSYFIESQPNVILEAMCLGVPVIGSSIGGVPELLDKRFLFTAGNVEEMTGKMIEMASAPGLLRAMHENNLAQRQLFSIEYRTQKLLELYRQAFREDGISV